MTLRTLTAIVFLLIIGIIGLAAFGFHENNQVVTLQKTLDQVQSSVAKLATSTQANIAATQSGLSALEKQVGTKTPAPLVPNTGSQSQSITAVVGRVAPSVVSVVISKSVPQLEIDYVNPFGDDPAYQNIGIRIPVYRQKGTTVQKVGAGSGFLISHNGYIVTNRHVVSDTQAEYTVLLSNGTQQNAQVVYRDPNYDVAVIKIPGNYSTVASLGDSSSLQLGESVIAIGNALGEYSNSVSVGIVSGLNRTIQAADAATGQIETINGAVQTDAAINPGNSGGPLIDTGGKVIGINVATVAGSNNIGFAIPINSIKQAIQSVVK